MPLQTVSHNHTAWKATAANRAAVLAEIDVQIDNVKACVRWLVGQGIFVEGVKFSRDGCKPRISVGASPLLHTLFKDDCSSGQHWDALLGCTMYDYKAVRYECSVCWSEVHQ